MGWHGVWHLSFIHLQNIDVSSLFQLSIFVLFLAGFFYSPDYHWLTSNGIRLTILQILALSWGTWVSSLEVSGGYPHCLLPWHDWSAVAQTFFNSSQLFPLALYHTAFYWQGLFARRSDFLGGVLLRWFKPDCGHTWSMGDSSIFVTAKVSEQIALQIFSLLLFPVSFFFYQSERWAKSLPKYMAI